jgi:hypothetical protein
MKDVEDWEAMWDADRRAYVNPWTGEDYDPDEDNGCHLPTGGPDLDQVFEDMGLPRIDEDDE